MSKIVKIIIPNELGYEHIPRVAVKRLAHQMGFSNERNEDIQMMVFEAALQAIRNGRHPNVDITFIINAEALTIRTVDIGPLPLDGSGPFPKSDLRDTTICHMIHWGICDEAEIRTTPEGDNEVEIVFYFVPQSKKRRLIQEFQEYWDAGEFLEAGILLFERIPRNLRPVWSTNLLEIVYKYGSPSEEVEAVIDLGRKPTEWINLNTDQYLETHNIVKAVNVLHSVAEEPLPKAIFTLARNVGKVIYNVYGYSAPFDHSAGWQIVENLKQVVDLVDNPDFTTKVWSFLCDEEFIELAVPVECSRGCPVCHSLFNVEGADTLVGRGEERITVERFFEITGFPQKTNG